MLAAAAEEHNQTGHQGSPRRRGWDDNLDRRLRLSRRISLKSIGDNALYMCLTQEDGHRAWSSPIYVFR